MELFCQSVDFKRCSIREAGLFVLEKKVQEEFLADCGRKSQISDALVLNTCNRLEFYFYAEDETVVSQVIEAHIGGIWKDYAGKFSGMDAAEHLFRVAAGLESPIIGENEIFSQLKAAYSFALACGSVNYTFHHLLHCAFRIAKAVRSQTEISMGALSVAGAAVATASINRELEKARVIVIGSGANAELLVKHLIKKKVQDITVAARNCQAGSRLGKYVPLISLSKCISNADVVFTATSSKEPLIKKEMVENRKNPLLLIDVSVPSNIEDGMSEAENVKVFDIESLKEVIKANNAKRRNEVPKAKAVVKEFLPQISNWLKTLKTETMVS
ncbi:MAG: Glutamyl-tRNA reductase [Planctomycetes bacterium ADurb.Bin401]|nr:MAG: Glutamyl-tRNA reductase [Planctomycetes bacterium ADurb.Bin401]